jgi:hypothetical protein
MSDIDRESRKKQTQEVFTQQRELDEILGHWTDEEILRNETFLDNSCGSGNILNAVLERKLSVGISLEDAIPTLFGVDFEITNVEECRTRLIKGNENLRHIVNRQIVESDSLRYHYRFDGSYPYDDELKQQQQEEHFARLFE